METNEDKQLLISYDRKDQNNDKGGKLNACPQANTVTAAAKFFQSKAEEAGIAVDDNGILIDKNGEAVYVSNIRSIEYLYTITFPNVSKRRVAGSEN